jgi:hypothetical protein
MVVAAPRRAKLPVACRLRSTSNWDATVACCKMAIIRASDVVLLLILIYSAQGAQSPESTSQSVLSDLFITTLLEIRLGTKAMSETRPAAPVTKAKLRGITGLPTI